MKRTQPHLLSAHQRAIGQRLRQLRLGRGLTEAQVCAALGMSPQAYMNRERGASEAQLAEIAILSGLYDLPIDAFFDGVPDDAVSGDGGGRGDERGGVDPDSLARAVEAEAFVRQLHQISTPRVREELIDFIRAIANQD